MIITEERFEELLAWLKENEFCEVDGVKIPFLRIQGLIAILEDHVKVKADNILFKEDICRLLVTINALKTEVDSLRRLVIRLDEGRKK